jgi:GTP:adenosylcobinamide-phosphate guanylyltransferase
VSAAPTAAADAAFTALVLAGSRGPDDPVAMAAGVAHKCLAPVAGVPMAVRVVEALAASPGINRIAVALQDPALVDQLPALHPLIAAGRCSLLPTAATPSLSVQQALDELPDPLPLLVTTGDHPLLTPEIVAHFCAAALGTGADLVAGLTPASAIKAAYPDAQRTYLRFREERYSGANLFAVLQPDGRRAVVFWRRVEQERKRPWRLVRAFGWRPLAAYLLGRLSLDEALARASKVIGARIAAVVLPQPEAAIDVDKPADLELVETILARRRLRETTGREPCAPVPAAIRGRQR